MATAIDLAAVRRRFPALRARDRSGRPLVHADAPGGTQLVDTAIAAMDAVMRRGVANQHGAFAISQQLDTMVAVVRQQVGARFGAPPEGVVFGPNMTSLTMHLARTFDVRLGPGDNLVLSQLDHDANVSPWLDLAVRTGAEVRWVPLDPATGRLHSDRLDELVEDRTRLVCFPAAANSLGTVVDPAPFVQAARRVGAVTVMDAVHAAPHRPLDRAALGVDVLLCSAYKFFGPYAGLLLADPALLAELAPQRLRPAPDRGPERWQTGTADLVSIAGVGAAVQYLDEVGPARIEAHEAALSERFLAGIAAMDHLRLYGEPTAVQRTPTFALTVAGWTPQEVAQVLAAQGIHVWAGHYYAVEPMRALGLLDRGGAVRIGFVHYHGGDDVDRVLAALAALRR